MQYMKLWSAKFDAQLPAMQNTIFCFERLPTLNSSRALQAKFPQMNVGFVSQKHKVQKRN